MCSITYFMETIKKALIDTFKKPHYVALCLSVALNVLFLYLWVFNKSATWLVFWESNTAFYNWSQIALSIITAILLGIAITFFFHVLEVRKKGQNISFLETVSSLVFSAAATGCPVCGAFLLPLLGIAASLSALPLGGLEVKLFSILVLLYAISEYAKVITGTCEVPKEKAVRFEKGRLQFNLTRETLPQLKPLPIFLLFVVFVYSLPYIPKQLRVSFKKGPSSPASEVQTSNKQTQTTAIFEQVNPPQGYELPTRFGDIGPQMIEMGVIDPVKFKEVYEKSGQPLTQEQLNILEKGSNNRIKVAPDNSYFLLNFFWAFGLANKSKILEEGEMVKYGDGQAGNFASTGGWSLSKEDSMNYYSKRALVPLSAKQEDLVEKVASGIYRPCCGNSTAFPDCNHGMALLGVLELMAAQGATENEMFMAAKYINSYWFPSTAMDVALYFKNKEGKDFAQIDPKIYLSQDYFSGQGYTTIKKWLTDNGIQEKPPTSGGGCGV